MSEIILFYVLLAYIGVLSARLTLSTIEKKRKTALKGPHVVQLCDTYWGIAKKYGTTVKKLRALNGYPDTKIPVGVELKVREDDKLSEGGNENEKI